ncbi:hypothetical protein B0H66DRAFT_603656 [Apodospora peruviana]|uniref:Uncharacterized protein n=1 Tax=Apodospora peruviana TaxID=516989 RepID=A0AAE0M4W7_9PEZI|nr:hypothetical protein B0H66DRAFT_603656 [Apodospora peruviana]
MATTQAPANLILATPLKGGTGRVLPIKSVLPTGDTALAQAQMIFSGIKHLGIRHVLPHDFGTGLIRIDGVVQPSPHDPDATGRWAFFHGTGPLGTPSVVSGRLERKGPFGDDGGTQTSHRALLRAAVAALRFRRRPDEAFHTLVIATADDNLTNCATTLAKTWIETGWKTSKGLLVKNRDMWEALLGEFERYADLGMAVQF